LAALYNAADWILRPIPSNWLFMDDETAWIVIVLRPVPQGLRAHVPCERDEAVRSALDSEREHNANLGKALDAALAKEGDELARLKLIMAYEASLIREGVALTRARQTQALSVMHTHPADLEYVRTVEAVDASARVVRLEPLPPPTFVCPACDETGQHFRAYCPLLRSRFEPSSSSSADSDEVMHPCAAAAGSSSGDVAAAAAVASAVGKMMAPLDRLTVLKGVPVNFISQVTPGASKTITPEGATVAVIDRQIVPRAHLPLYSYLLSTGQGSVAETIRVYEEALPPLDVPPATGGQLEFEPYTEALDRRMQLLESRFYADHPALAKKGTQCLHFLKGKCYKGYLVCEFSHNLAAKRAVCAFFAENKCKAGTECAFIHPDQIHEYMIRPEKTNGLAPSSHKNKSAVDAAKEKRRAVKRAS